MTRTPHRHGPTIKRRAADEVALMRQSDAPRVPRMVLPSREVVYLDVECQLTVEEVGGFHPLQTRQRKLAVAVVYQPGAGRFRAYGERDVHALSRDLAEAELMIGYNLHHFDLEILRGYAGAQVDSVNVFDLFEDIRRRTGQRWSPAELSAATLKLPSPVGGNEVTGLFKQGALEACEDACRDHVQRIARIHQFGVAHGFVFGSRPGESRRTKIPVEW